MKTITTLTDYCHEINILPPLATSFDIRRFEDNMKTVNKAQPPFRHEFYAIALRLEGTNTEVMGKPLNASIFFNSPYQIVTWDIAPDWKGWYIIFDKDFISRNPAWNNFIIDYPFFRLDKYIPFDLPPAETHEANRYFERIHAEYHSQNEDRFTLIQAYTHLLLAITKRYFDRIHMGDKNLKDNRTADILLVSRFQALLESMTANENADGAVRQPSFYAEQLSVHPNHLNAVVKRITGKTASHIVQNQLIVFAQSLLQQTNLSIKEIAFRLHFTEPTHFNAFFKKNTGQTPQQFRDAGTT